MMHLVISVFLELMKYGINIAEIELQISCDHLYSHHFSLSLLLIGTLLPFFMFCQPNKSEVVFH